MADYYGKGRTTTFLVNDVDTLKQALAGTEFTVEERPKQGAGAVVILASHSDGAGCWGQLVYPNPDVDEDPDELLVPDIIAAHLRDGQVAVFDARRSRKAELPQRYSIAVHSSGQQVRIDINDIYRLAADTFNVSADAIDSADY